MAALGDARSLSLEFLVRIPILWTNQVDVAVGFWDWTYCRTNCTCCTSCFSFSSRSVAVEGVTVLFMSLSGCCLTLDALATLTCVGLA